MNEFILNFYLETTPADMSGMLFQQVSHQRKSLLTIFASLAYISVSVSDRASKNINSDNRKRHGTIKFRQNFQFAVLNILFCDVGLKFQFFSNILLTNY